MWRTSDADDNTLRLLEFVDIHDALETKFLKVQAIRLVEVGRDRLRIVVDHDCAPAHLAELARASDGAPVKLHARANAVYAAA